jgi:AraC-like DNA-binding protein
MRADPGGAGPFAVSIETDDLDEAREVCGDHLYPRTLRLLDGPARLAARFSFLHMASLTVADVRYGAEIAGECGELGSYHVNVPVAGSFTARHGGRQIHANPGRAGVYRPGGRNILRRSSADCRLLAVKVDPAVLEGQLAAYLDAPVRGPLRLASELDLRAPPGRSCADLIRLLGDEINNPTGLVYQPIVAAPLEECLLMSLLYAVDHQYSGVLRRPEGRSAGRHIARVVAVIHEEPERPHTIAALARIAEMSPRSLQYEFHRQVGVPPMAYVRQVRLVRAHAELLAADPDQTTVAEIARRWGFPTTGRFAARYRARFGTPPSRTLRGRAGRARRRSGEQIGE